MLVVCARLCLRGRHIAYAEITSRFAPTLAGRVNAALNLATFVGAFSIHGLRCDAGWPAGGGPVHRRQPSTHLRHLAGSAGRRLRLGSLEPACGTGRNRHATAKLPTASDACEARPHALEKSALAKERTGRFVRHATPRHGPLLIRRCGPIARTPQARRQVKSKETRSDSTATGSATARARPGPSRCPSGCRAKRPHRARGPAPHPATASREPGALIVGKGLNDSACVFMTKGPCCTTARRSAVPAEREIRSRPRRDQLDRHIGADFDGGPAMRRLPPTVTGPPLKRYKWRRVPVLAGGMVQRAPALMRRVQIAMSASSRAAQESGGGASGCTFPCSPEAVLPSCKRPAITAISVVGTVSAHYRPPWNVLRPEHREVRRRHLRCRRKVEPDLEEFERVGPRIVEQRKHLRMHNATAGVSHCTSRRRSAQPPQESPHGRRDPCGRP